MVRRLGVCYRTFGNARSFVLGYFRGWLSVRCKSEYVFRVAVKYGGTLRDKLPVNQGTV